MEALFLNILNMSLTASYVILAILLVRLLLRKAPKKYAYALWGVAAFRLCCPVSFQSVFSLFNLGTFFRASTQSSGGAARGTTLQYIPENIGFMSQPQVTVGAESFDAAVSSSLPAASPATSVNPMQIWIFVGTVLWCVGMAGMALYAVFSYLQLKRKMDDAILMEKNVYLSEKVDSPFVLGFVHPKIYLPFHLDGDTERYVLRHERYHLKRRDHLVKQFAFLLLVLHWFNPLCWVAFALMSKDMEMSCDEKVLAAEQNIRKAYSTSLLSFAVSRRVPSISPLAFGEVSVKARIKNVLNWKKPKRWITVAAMAVCVAAVAACASNPKAREEADGIHPEKEQVYVSSECLFMNPLSSFYPVDGDSGNRYILQRDGVRIEKKEGGDVVFQRSLLEWNWEKLPYTKEEWGKMCLSEEETVQIERYENPLCLTLADQYSLFDMDGDLWIVQWNEDPQGEPYVWSIYRLVPEPEGSIGAESESQNSLESSITEAVLAENRDLYSAGSFACESHEILATKEESNEVTVYALVLYEEFDKYDGELEVVSGSYIPTALTFERTDSGTFVLQECWRPRDGSYYTSDIREKFPQDTWIATSNMQDYIEELERACEEQANAFYGDGDTNDILAQIFEAILFAPAESSNPQDYIRDHQDEYDLLVSLEEKTLRYAFGEFLGGGQTDLKGQVMAAVCRDILSNMGETTDAVDTYENGQAWFDAFRQQAEKDVRQNGADEMEKYHPGEWMLHRMSE